MKPIHPFPARMAPDICQRALASLPAGSRVLDPMCGSGTVLRGGVEIGHECVGLDMDPLAVLIAECWVTPTDPQRLIADAEAVCERARALDSDVEMPWREAETEDFARYWFAERQCRDLARLSFILRRSRLRSRPFLWLCLSRLVITKDRGASLARDVSHSRPHRVIDDNDFDVLRGFERSARLVAARLEPDEIHASASVVRGDARHVQEFNLGQFDAVVTSPPYLNAIDYLRGHRLALIWMGHEVGSLRRVRSAEVGAEVGGRGAPIDVEPFIGGELEARFVGWVKRYCADMTAVFEGLRSAVKSDGKVVIVVGNSFLRGVCIDNAALVTASAVEAGFVQVGASSREIPARRRYLPLPKGGSPLSKRMRRETVLELRSS